MAKKRNANPHQLDLFDDWLISDSSATAKVTENVQETTERNEIVEQPQATKNLRYLLSLNLANKLDKDGVITSSFLTSEANRFFGGTQAEGAYSSKDAYDAMEAAFNIHLSRTESADWINQNAVSAQSKATQLTQRIQSLPTQTRRDEEMDDMSFVSEPNLEYRET